MTIEIRQYGVKAILTVEAISEKEYTFCMWHYPDGPKGEGHWACMTMTPLLHKRLKAALAEVDAEQQHLRGLP